MEPMNDGAPSTGRADLVERLMEVSAGDAHRWARSRLRSAADSAEAVRERRRKRRDAERWGDLTLGPRPVVAVDVDQEDHADDSDLTLAKAVATHVLAAGLAERTSGPRSEKMALVVAIQRASIDALLEEGEMKGLEPRDLLMEIVEDWSLVDRTRLLIDLDFTEPFAPHELKVDEDDFDDALRSLASSLGLGAGVVAKMEDIRRSAERAHLTSQVAKVAIAGAAGIVLVGSGAWVLAPIIGGALGGAAGLSGAAATAHGLALIGGGAVSAGGAGMAGGLWLVTGVGVAAGGVGGGGSALLYGMGARQAQLELVRLQVTFRMTVLDNQISVLKAQSVITSLQEQLEGLRRGLDEERTLNDENSSRLKDLEKKIESTERALEWMEAEKDSAA